VHKFFSDVKKPADIAGFFMPAMAVFQSLNNIKSGLLPEPFTDNKKGQRLSVGLFRLAGSLNVGSQNR
jgi:hypothetical protein